MDCFFVLHLNDISGPNEYSLPNLLGHHKTPPAHILGYRLYDKDPFVTPGPGAYSHDNFGKVLRHAPQFSIGVKITEKNDKGTPGPGAYCHEKVSIKASVIGGEQNFEYKELCCVGDPASSHGSKINFWYKA